MMNHEVMYVNQVMSVWVVHMMNCGLIFSLHLTG